MRGFVNYYIDEEQENYEVVRGEKDIYKFTLSQTEIELRDPTKEEIPLDFKHDGIIFTDHVTHVNLQTDFKIHEKCACQNYKKGRSKRQCKDARSSGLPAQ